jgi:hypothetical protein
LNSGANEVLGQRVFYRWINHTSRIVIFFRASNTFVDAGELNLAVNIVVRAIASFENKLAGFAME